MEIMFFYFKCHFSKMCHLVTTIFKKIEYVLISIFISNFQNMYTNILKIILSKKNFLLMVANFITSQNSKNKI